nr:hypothetical protein [Tanacetum cinerariifolium]
LPPWPTRVALRPDGIAAAQLQGDTVLLQRYTTTGELLPTLTYQLSSAAHTFAGYEHIRPSQLLYYDGKYFTYWQNQVMWLAESGRHRLHVLPAEVFQLVRSPYAAELSLAAVSEEGFMRWEPGRPANNVPWEQLVADNTEPTIYSLCFISATYLVSLNTNHAALYELGPDGA